MAATRACAQIRSWRPYPRSLCLIGDLDAEPAAQGARVEAGRLRARQSIAVRALACKALTALGGPAGPIGKNADGAPSWPAGWTGSLAHDRRSAVALVGSTRQFDALGVDVEPDEPLPSDALLVALTDREQAHLSGLPGGLERWSRVAFCAKESLHKCLHPRYGLWLEFDEVETRIDPHRLQFTLEPVTSRAKTGLGGIDHGLIRLIEGQVLTALGIFATADRGT